MPPSRLTRPGRTLVLKPVRPSIGLTVEYRRQLLALIDRMHKETLREIEAAYRDDPPVLATDTATPADVFRRVMTRLGNIWEKRFDLAAPRLAEWFSQKAANRSDKRLKQILRDGGISVKFQASRAVRDVMAASVNENVGLIKSIQQQYHQRVSTAVMQSAMTGRDIGALTRELSQGYGITQRRAALIARDQNNKMTSVIERARQEEVGITEAIWLHSGGGRHPRPEHVAFSGKRYDIKKGAYLEGKWTWPGFEINCRCSCRAVIPGLDN